MSEKIKLVQGDTRPAIVVTLTDEKTGSPLNLTGATVRLYFRQVGFTELQATVVASVTDPEQGVCVFFPSTAPEMLSGVAGDYEGEIEITFADSTIQTVFGVLKFKVREDF